MPFFNIDSDDYTAREALDRVWADHQRSLYTSFPARITAVDLALGVVDVEPAMMLEVPGEEQEALEFEDLGELVNIPIQWPRGGGFVLTFPLKVGDYVAIHCSVQSLMVWRKKGGVHQPPGISDPHGLNGCFAVPGCFPDVERVKNVSSSAFEMRNEAGSTVVSIARDGSVTFDATKVRVEASQVRLDSADVVAGNGPAPQAVALSPLVEQAIAAAVIAHTHVVPVAPAPVTSATGIATAPVSSTAASNLKAT